MSLTAGTKLGPYEIESAIGAGGMGEVYRARDTRLDRTVAVKVLPAHIAERSEAKQRFEREARAVSSLNHPHICALYDIGQQDGIDFLVMEYLEGETLSSRLARGPLAVAEVIEYALQMADALTLAHRQSVFHRDLKPANIMLTKSGTKLLDFGLAKLGAGSRGSGAGAGFGTTVDGGLTVSGTILGTFQYMAPEQVEGKDTDARSDIFAFGAVLYEMATGKKAFEGKSHASVMAAILERDPPAISTLQPMSPPALDWVVKTCLEKDPDDRWQSARDLLRELKRVRQPEAAPAVPTSVLQPPPPTPRARLRWPAVAAVALLAALVLAFVHFREKPPEIPSIQFSVYPPEKTTLLSISVAGPLAMSPDGRLLAFAAVALDGRQLLWIRRLDSLVAQPLAGTQGATYPFWSPDSRYIGFFAGGKLKKVEASGGPPQALCDATVGRGGSWSREGIIIFAPAPGAGLQRVPAAGGAPTPATTLNSSRQENTHRWPHFLPDGRRFLYWARSSQPDHTGIYVASQDLKETRLLLRGDTTAAYTMPSSDAKAGYLFFIRDRSLMAQPFDPVRAELSGDAFPVAEGVGYGGNGGAHFAASTNGVVVYRAEGAAQRSQLTWFDREGRPAGVIGGPGDNGRPVLSPDEKFVAVEREDSQTSALDIWLVDVSRGANSRFTFSRGLDWFPVWSPDSSRILFSSTQEGALGLYQKPASGAGKEESVLKTAEPKFPWSWSPDGRFVIYSTLTEKTKYDLWILPLAGERKPFPFAQSEFSEMRAQFSPDGRWIAYNSDETSRPEVYVRRFTGESGPAASSGQWQVSINGGNYPKWRRDGKELFFVSPDRKMMAVEVQADGESFKSGVPRALFDARIDPSVGTRQFYNVSADGKRFLMNVPLEESSSAPIQVVVNWQPKR